MQSASTVRNEHDNDMGDVGSRRANSLLIRSTHALPRRDTTQDRLMLREEGLAGSDSECWLLFVSDLLPPLQTRAEAQGPTVKLRKEPSPLQLDFNFASEACHGCNHRESAAAPAADFVMITARPTEDYPQPESRHNCFEMIMSFPFGSATVC